MNWISRLERKYGRFCIPNLISIIVGGQILVYAIELFVNQFISVYLGLSRSLLLMGTVMSSLPEYRAKSGPTQRAIFMA